MVALLVLLIGAAQAQPADSAQVRVVTIVNADSVAGTVVAGERVRTLMGNVHLRQDSTDLRARRAVQYLDRDEIVFEGDVEIADPTDTLYAARVTYDSRTRFGRAEGDVRLAGDEAVLFSTVADYHRTERRAEFPEPVRLEEREGGVLTSRRGTYLTDREEAHFEGDLRLVDSLTVLTSQRGRYATGERRADFFDDVVLQREQSTRLEADTVTHFRDTEVSIARGDVLVERFGGPDDADAEVPPDTTRRTLLFGGYAYHDERARYSRVEQDPLLVRLQTDSTGTTDSLLVRARTLEAFQPDSLDGQALPDGTTLQRLLAREDVRIYSAQLAAVADSAAFERLEWEDGLPPDSARVVLDEIRLFREPVGWLQARGSSVVTEVSGDTLLATARGEAIDSLHVFGRAFAARRDSALARVNQIRGRRMLAQFQEDTLRWLKVWPNAEAIYYRAGEDGQLAGAVQISADSIAFRFRGEELGRVHAVGRPEGTYYDAPLVPGDLQLEGYRYHPERRPTRAGLLGENPLERRRSSSPAEPVPASEPLREEPADLDPFPRP